MELFGCGCVGFEWKSVNDDSDWNTVAQAQAGDETAFAELVRRYEHRIVQFCYRMTGSAQDAEDLAQESFIRLYRHLHRLTPKAKFSTLLYGIARNLALNAVRDAGRRARMIAPPPDNARDIRSGDRRPDEWAHLKELDAMIHEGLQALSPAHREILVLREFNGLDYDAIARIIRCRKGTVRSRLARAREQLRIRIEQAGGKAV